LLDSQEKVVTREKETQPANGDEDLLTKNSKPDVSGGSDIRQEMPSETLNDVHPPVPTPTGKEIQARKKNGVQPVNVNQKGLLSTATQDDVQFSEVTHHRHTKATSQSLDVKTEVLDTEKARVVGGVQPLVSAPEHLEELPPKTLPDVQPSYVHSPVPTRDTRTQPRKNNGVQSVNVNRQIPLSMGIQNGVQHSEVAHHQEPITAIQSPDADEEIPEMQGEEMIRGVRALDSAQEHLLDEMHEQRKTEVPMNDTHQKVPPVETQGHILISGIAQATVAINKGKPKDSDPGIAQRPDQAPNVIKTQIHPQNAKKQARKRTGVQPINVNQQRPLPIETQNYVQPSEIIHHEEPAVIMQSSDKTSHTEEGEAGYIPPSEIITENPPSALHEQQPRKKIIKALHEHQEEAQVGMQTSSVAKEEAGTHREGLSPNIPSQDSEQEAMETVRRMPEWVERVQHPIVNTEISLLGEKHQNGRRHPDAAPNAQPRKKRVQALDNAQPMHSVQNRQPRKRVSKNEVQSPDVDQE
jgi:hypothetical protein